MPEVAQMSIEASALFTARAFRHHGYAPAPPLSVKCMFESPVGSEAYFIIWRRKSLE
jgi:hypothetical protein